MASYISGFSLFSVAVYRLLVSGLLNVCFSPQCRIRERKYTEERTSASGVRLEKMPGKQQDPQNAGSLSEQTSDEYFQSDADQQYPAGQSGRPCKPDSKPLADP